MDFKAMALSAATVDAVALSPFTGPENQLWRIDQFSDGSYRLASKSGKLAFTTTTPTKSGNGITLQPFTGTATQRWIITAP